MQKNQTGTADSERTAGAGMQRKLIYEKYKKHHKEWVLFVYLALRILIVAAIIISILSQRWKGVLSCILALVLLLLPSVL